MSVTITSRPSALIGSNTSKFTAGHNPVIYLAQREDYAVAEIDNASGSIRIDVGSNITSEVSDGDTIYLKTNDFTTNYDQNVTVNGAPVWTGSETQITCDQSIITGSTGTTADSFINLLTNRPQYYLEVEIFSDITDLALITQKALFVPSPKGLITIDLSTYLKDFLDSQNDVDFDASSGFNSKSGQGFYIKHTENWTGSSESQVDDVANQFVSCNSVKQIADTYGANMAQYVLFNNPSPVTKIPTPLSKLRISEDHKFSYSVLMGEAGSYLAEIQWLSSSGSQIAKNITILPPALNKYARVITDSPPSNAASAEIEVYKSGITSTGITADDLQAVHFGFGTTTAGWVVGANAGAAVIYRTPAFSSWTSQTLPGSPVVLNAIQSTRGDISIAIAVGAAAAASYIVSTSDEGSTWTSRTPASATEPLNGVSFDPNDDDVAWVVGNIGDIEKTTNGGVGWSAQTPSSNENLNAVHATEDGPVIIVGDNGFINRTTNGGTNWNLIESNVNQNLNGVWFATNSDVGVACGDNGTIIRSTDNGATWANVSIQNITDDFFSVHAVDENVWFISGSGGKWYGSCDAGQTWTDGMLATISVTEDIQGIWVTSKSDIHLVDAAGDHRRIANDATTTATLISEVKEVEIKRDLVNVVHLMWTNSLGGDAHWYFENRQLIAPILGRDAVKRNRSTLYTTGLDRTQWDALNELNTLGEITGEIVNDLTTDTRDRQRAGVQAYVVETDGTKTPVIVIPRANRFDNKFVTNDFVIDIEYPEIYQLV